jgi:hypothetical protein
MDRQATCSSQASEALRHFGWESRDALSYTTHFNPDLGRCLLAARWSEFVDGRRHYFHLRVVETSRTGITLPR